MRIKEVERTANAAWSPASHDRIYLAAGTVGEQVDSTFNTAAALDIFSLDVQDDGLEMPLTASIPSEQRFYKLLWSPFGISDDHSDGILVGGADLGKMMIYDANKILNGEDGLIFSSNKHAGPVRALDFNPFKEYLLISGAADSELFIWDLNDTSIQMTPGEKAEPLDTITCASWNRQVSHILMSSFSSKILIWDLRKSEPIIKVRDSMSRMCCKSVAWHPDVATQLCLASEDDHYPVIQIWDLRFATSPLKTLERHQKGILSVSWCAQDPELLLSCGKDSKILCWNPESNVEGGEVVCEIPTGHDWSFEVSWCPKNPCLIQSSCYDGKISIYSLLGGYLDKEVDSFPISEVNNHLGQATQHLHLSKPPKWMRSKMRASFGFGGKLLRQHEGTEQPEDEARRCRLLDMCKVVTEAELVSRASHLVDTISGGAFDDYCNHKVTSCGESDRHCWQLLGAKQRADPVGDLLQLIGYQRQVIPSKLNRSLEATDAQLCQDTRFVGTAADENCGPDQYDEPPVTTSRGEKEVDENITHAIITGNIAAAVESCLAVNKVADAIILAMSEGSDLLNVTLQEYFKKANSCLSRLIVAVSTGRWEPYIQNSNIDDWKQTLACIIKYNKGDCVALCDSLGKWLAAAGKTSEALLCFVWSGNVDLFVSVILAKEECLSTAHLQDVVELSMILYKTSGYERMGKIGEGPLYNLLTNYSSVLTSQGELESALLYLQMLDDTIDCELRSRLKMAFRAPGNAGRSSTTQSFSSTTGFYTDRRGDLVPPILGTNMCTPVTRGEYSLHDKQQVPNKKMTRKYVPDPSVYQGPVYMPDNCSQPMGVPYSDPMAHPATSRDYHSGDQLYGGGMPRLDVYNESSGFAPDIIASSILTPTATDMHNPQVEPETTYVQSNPGPAAPGWNDPPMLSNFSRRKSDGKPEILNPVQQPLLPSVPGHQQPHLPSTPGHHQPHLPSTPGHQQLLLPSVPGHQQPLLPSVPGHQQPHLPSTPGHQQPHLPSTPGHQQLLLPSVPGHQQPHLPSVFGHQHFEIYNDQINPKSGCAFIGDNIPYLGATESGPILKTSTLPEEKPPIAPEHLPIFDIFELLKQKCYLVAKQPQLKKKVSDSEKKLEVLYDKLRSSSLSEWTISGLMNIVAKIKQGEYQEALQLHTQMITTGVLSEISPFMPGIKTLIQAALQMGVYVQ